MAIEPAYSISLEALDLLPDLSLRRWMKTRLKVPSGIVRGKKKQVTSPSTFASEGHLAAQPIT
jgi:hypothetical protein